MNETIIAALLALMPVCAPNTHIDTMRALVKTESAFNQYAIAVVDKAYPPYKQPTNIEEAKKLIEKLEAGGKNYSIGLGQINKSNFERLGVTAIDLLEPCLNLNAAEIILKECFDRTDKKINDALSCYYSGNFKTGYKKASNGVSYVQMVHKNNTPFLLPATANSDKNYSIPSIGTNPYTSWVWSKDANAANSQERYTTQKGKPIKNISLIK